MPMLILPVKNIFNVYNYCTAGNIKSIAAVAETTARRGHEDRNIKCKLRGGQR